MKKFLFVCIVLFIANVGCKKTNIDGGALCGCTVAPAGPQLRLVIKNNAGDDLLDEKTAGAYSKTKIEMFRKDANNKNIPIDIYINPPFRYDNENFKYYQLHASVYYLSTMPDSKFYLKLSEKTYELNAQLNTSKNLIDKLFANNKEIEKENGALAKYNASIFYLVD